MIGPGANAKKRFDKNSCQATETCLKPDVTSAKVMLLSRLRRSWSRNCAEVNIANMRLSNSKSKIFSRSLKNDLRYFLFSTNFAESMLFLVACTTVGQTFAFNQLFVKGEQF